MKGNAAHPGPALPLVQAMPHLAVFQRGCVAAASLFAVIELPPAQQAEVSTLQPGRSPEHFSCGQLALADPSLQQGGVNGDLELAEVSFSFPSRPERSVLSGLSLVFPAGGKAGGELRRQDNWLRCLGFLLEAQHH